MRESSRLPKLYYLIRAIKSQDEDYTNNVTTENLNINDNDDDDGNALHLAARIGNYEIFQKLIKIGADIHKRDPKTQETVLDSAMNSFNYDIVRYLKENGVEKSDRFKGETALQFAADEGTKEVMTLLSSNNTDINAKSVNGITPISNDVKAKNHDHMHASMKYVFDLFSKYEGDDATNTIFNAAAGIHNYTALENWLNSFSSKLGLKNINGDISSELDERVDITALEQIKRHIEELIAAGFYVNKRYIEAVSKTKIFNDSSAECLLEIEKMKNNVIEGSNITFIEILHKNVRYLARYLKIVDLNKILIREPQFPEYPIYENKIFFKLWKVQIRVNYIKNSEEVIHNIFYELQLPDTFIRELYLYLSNEDLKEIVQPSR